MSNGPLISIVTPSFNQGGFIEQTILSVLDQDYQNLELWVIDAASTDETLSILRKFEGDQRFQFLSEPDSGQSEAINKGLKRARGEIFNWLNSDDYLEPGALRKVAEAFAHPIHLFSGRVRKFEEPGGATTGYYELEIDSQVEGTLALGRFCQPSTFWRTDIFRELGGVQQKMTCAMDYHLWAKYLMKYGLASIQKTTDILAHFREHEESKSFQLNKKFKDEINGVYLDLLKTLKAPELLCETIRAQTTREYQTPWTISREFNPKRFMAVLAYDNARKFYYDRQFRRARELARLSWKLFPLFNTWRLKCKLLIKQ